MMVPCNQSLISVEGVGGERESPYISWWRGFPQELDVAALVSSEAYLPDAIDGASTAYPELADQVAGREGRDKNVRTYGSKCLMYQDHLPANWPETL